MTPAARLCIGGALGSGSFGTVYEVFLDDPHGFRRRLALKVLNPNAAFNKLAIERLRDEARILGLLHHNAIVQVHGLCHLPGGPWGMLMEGVDGMALSTLLKRGPLPPLVAVEVILVIASALSAARETPGPDGRPLQVVHRDLKPANVLLTRHGEVKLLDFGVAFADFDARESRTVDMAFGSPNYIAPEVALGVRDASVDIYALGVTLYELLVGDPFGRANLDPARHAHRLEQRSQRLEVELGEQGRALAHAVGAMVAWDPARRLPMAELRLVLEKLREWWIGEQPLWSWAATAIPQCLQTRERLPDGLLTGSSYRMGPLTPEVADFRMDTDNALALGSDGFEVESSGTVDPAAGHRRVWASLLRPVMREGAGRWTLPLAFAAGLLLGFGGAPRVSAVEASPMTGAGIGEVAEASGEPTRLDTSAPSLDQPEPESVAALAPLATKGSARVGSTSASKISPAAVTPAIEVSGVESEPETPRASSPPARGLVGLGGDATRVSLSNEMFGSHTVPGEVPAGTYTILVSFNGEPARPGGFAVVAPDRRLELNCRATFGRCQSTLLENP